MFTSTRRVLATAACTLGVLALGVGPASAGEITGNGKTIQMHAASECAFSGQNDGFHDPSQIHEGEDPVYRVQNWGHVRAFLPMKGVPGYACNPSGKRTLPFPE